MNDNRASMKKTALTKDEELSLLCEWQATRNQESFELLLAAHDKFCRKVAYDFVRKKHDIPLDDLHQQARIGLLIAADKYDLNSGVRFLSYAGDYIRGEVLNHIQECGNTVRHSVVTLKHVRNLDRIREKFFVAAGTYPSLGELSNLSGIKPKATAKYAAMAVASTSLDEPQRDLYGQPMLDSLTEEDMPEPIDAVEFKELMERIAPAIEKLKPKEQEIIRMHFLSDEWDEATFKDLGDRIGVSKAEAFRIEKSALKKLGQLLTPELLN